MRAPSGSPQILPTPLLKNARAKRDTTVFANAAAEKMHALSGSPQIMPTPPLKKCARAKRDPTDFASVPGENIIRLKSRDQGGRTRCDLLLFACGCKFLSVLALPLVRSILHAPACPNISWT